MLIKKFNKNNVIMKTQQKLFIVLYCGTKNMSFSNEEIHENLIMIKKTLETTHANNEASFFIVPNSEIEFPNIKIECINPILVSDKEYKNITATLKNIEKIIDKSFIDMQSVNKKKILAKKIE